MTAGRKRLAGWQEKRHTTRILATVLAQISRLKFAFWIATEWIVEYDPLEIWLNSYYDWLGQGVRCLSSRNFSKIHGNYLKLNLSLPWSNRANLQWKSELEKVSSISRACPLSLNKIVVRTRDVACFFSPSVDFGRGDFLFITNNRKRRKATFQKLIDKHLQKTAQMTQ